MGGASENVLRLLIKQKNKAILCICLNKTNKTGSSNKNYLELDVLPVGELYNKFTISFILKKLPLMENITNKRETIAYDIKINYPKKV